MDNIYNIGDKVYIMQNNKIKEVYVRAIMMLESELLYSLSHNKDEQVGLNNMSPYTASNVYGLPTDLADSLLEPFMQEIITSNDCDGQTYMDLEGHTTGELNMTKSHIYLVGKGWLSVDSKSGRRLYDQYHRGRGA